MRNTQKASISAGVYCRISQDQLGTGAGVERQRQDCEKLTAAKGWRVADTYIDNDVSAYSGKPRPEYRRLLRDIEDGAIQAVVVWHLDRLHRRPVELEEFMQICDERHVQLATVQGDVDLDTSSGRLHARLMGAVARHESEHKSERIKRAFLEKAKLGKPWIGGSRGLGYLADRMTIVEEEAETIREGIARILAGDSLRSVCLDLNSRGRYTAEGNPWIQRNLKRVLSNPRNAGLRRHAELGLVKGNWPPIISEEDWRRVSAILNDPTRGRRGPPRRHLLSGILRCGLCGKKLASGPKQEKIRSTYICLPPPYGCHGVAITAGWVEDFITEAVLEALQNPTADTDRGRRDDAIPLRAIENDRALLDELAVLFSQRKITSSEWLKARAPIEARIEDAQASIAANSRTTLVQRLRGEGTDLRELWPSLDVEKQRALIESVIDHIVVNRHGGGRYRDPSRLVPVWKH